MGALPADFCAVELPCAKRRAGVLASVFSLPTADFGFAIDVFLDFMQQSGLTVWQVLPLGPPLMDGSPYQCSSSFALNPAFLSDDVLRVDEGFAAQCSVADRRQGRGLTIELQHEWSLFQVDEAHWLNDYALFMAIKSSENYAQWIEWQPGLRDRQPEALSRFADLHADLLFKIKFEQFLLQRQWQRVVGLARLRGILVYGDLPIFVAGDSADIWANRSLFQLDERGLPIAVAGVPPDYFSTTGQRWGNPLFNWDKMQADGFVWWRARFKRHVALFDWVRIDHFRGLAAYWSIPAACDTAIDGQWINAPGFALLEALAQDCGNRLPVIAEDLGVITDDVVALRKAFNLPGMMILQFAFDSDELNPYLPASHEPDSVVYTGTHDNDTTLGWWLGLDEPAKLHVRRLLNQQLSISMDEPMPMALIHAAMASVSQLAVIPMADWLNCDSRGRINTPGTQSGNWLWQFSADVLTDELALSIRQLVAKNLRLV
jgi:4-alpha-glucanotransferase